ncbi:hypothetical protein ARMSODRAFT_268733 [Armillaria solidipes]|uniref:Uncharacterized protein n=1 Tax=Armillaria solidipes TaxID=1076256 RepID=A0A2H3CDC8_9AGAR|nr:hypothetical protein ARMSODRAFT_268733 [Armillaria solidipes]
MMMGASMYGQQRQRQSILVVFFLLILPLFALAQSNTGSAQGQVSTIFSLASSGTVTSIATILTTITNTASSSSASGNSSSSALGNSTSTASGNTKSQSHTSDTSTTPSNLPTASTDGVNGGGGTAGAPSPGATDSNGNTYGPDDSYIAGATALQRNGLMIGLVGVAVGVAMTLL